MIGNRVQFYVKVIGNVVLVWNYFLKDECKERIKINK